MNKKSGLIFTILLVSLVIIWIIINKQLSSNQKSESNNVNLEKLVDNIVESGVFNKPIDTNDPLLKQRKIIISFIINESLAYEISSKLLYLDNLNHDSITILISTNGGWGTCAKQIIETMQLIKSPVNIVATGTCYSSGALLLVSATGKRYATRSTLFMIHTNLYDPMKTAGDHKYYNEWYEKVWKDNASLPEKWFPMVGDSEYYLNAEEALKYKCIDKIIDKLE